MPEFVIDRIRDIMNENGITDISKVGLYGLTYKEDIDDMRESPTVQLMDKLERFFVKGIKLYDPWIEEKKYEGQYMDFESFVNDIELVVIMVGHTHIKENIKSLEDKLVLDTRNIINLDKVYKL